MRVGLTGGIASGKSIVADMFADHGVPIIDTDLIARQIVVPGEPALDAIRTSFGNDVFSDDGTLDRSALRKLVFANTGQRRQLEAIMHPRIQQETIDQATAAGGDYQLIVVPLLTESPLKDLVDRILVVDCDQDIQMQRLLLRDEESQEQAQRILAAQASREDRLAIADDVVYNDASLDATRSQVDTLHDTYQQLAKAL